MTEMGLVIPPVQKASQILSTWLRSLPVSMVVPYLLRVGYKFIYALSRALVIFGLAVTEFEHRNPVDPQ